MGSVRITQQERESRNWRSRRIYVLWAVGTTLFKIGIAASPRRIQHVKACSPVELLLVALRPGTLRDEFNLHNLLHCYRHHGEWFNLPEAEVWKLMQWACPMEFMS